MTQTNLIYFKFLISYVQISDPDTVNFCCELNRTTIEIKTGLCLLSTRYRSLKYMQTTIFPMPMYYNTFLCFAIKDVLRKHE